MSMRLANVSTTSTVAVLGVKAALRTTPSPRQYLVKMGVSPAFPRIGNAWAPRSACSARGADGRSAPFRDEVAVEERVVALLVGRGRDRRHRWSVAVARSGSLAFGLVNFFFTPPYHTFTIAEGEHVLALVVFLVVAAVVALYVHSRRSQRDRVGEVRAEAVALDAANELRTALLNAVSHDLRTPLASIKASVSSLRADDVAWCDARGRRTSWPRSKATPTASTGLSEICST